MNMQQSMEISDDDDDDDDVWEALPEQSKRNLTVQSGVLLAVPPTSDEVRTPTASPTDDEGDEAQGSDSGYALQLNKARTETFVHEKGSRADNQSRLLAARTRLESKTQIEDKLVKNPLDLIWRRFWVHLLREGREHDFKIQLAAALIVTGLVTKAVLFSTAVLWYPRLLLAQALILVSFFYLNPFFLPLTFERVLSTLRNPSMLVDSLTHFDSTISRKFIFCVLFVPTLLEIRSLQFLSHIQIGANWGMIYYAIVAVLLSSVMGICFKMKKTPKECTHYGLVTLYGLSLLVALVQFEVWSVPFLLAPFNVAFGIILLHSVDDKYEWCTKSIRLSLKLALRDALALVKDSFTQDEMLQLAMLRWTVDYWGSTPPNRTAEDKSTTNCQRGPRSTPASDINSTRCDFPLVPVPTERDLSWSELLPMLALTSEQIRLEVETLRGQEIGLWPDHLFNTTGEKAITVHQKSRKLSPTEGSSTPSASTERSSASFSIMDFQSMLATMDLDVHAKPAVDAYKMVVYSLQPSREAAIMLSIARRCPALLALLWELLFVGSGSFTIFLVLVPFIAFELLRCREWSESCNAAASNSPAASHHLPFANGGFLELVDPMVILLSGDHFSLQRPPTLLSVWMNIVSSVSALEKSLTAVRCVQTATAAISFAQNMVSLADFTLQIKSQGWIHGVGIMAKELITYYRQASMQSSASPLETRYTSAAINAFNSSRIISKNMRILREQENAIQTWPPVFQLMSPAFGMVWSWKRDEVGRTSDQHSSVTIEELPSEPIDAADQLTRQQLAHDEYRDSGDDAPEDRIAAANEGFAKEKMDVYFSEIFGLLEAVSSYNLIEEMEKGQLCQRLSLMKLNDSPDEPWLLATKRTLEGLLVINGLTDEFAGMSSNAVKMELARTCRAPTSNLDEASSKTENHHLSQSSTSLPAVMINDRDFNSQVTEDSRDGSEATSEEQLRRSDSMAMISHASAAQQAANNSESCDNFWLREGSLAGLAVMGAVVGVAAIAIECGKKPDFTRRESRR